MRFKPFATLAMTAALLWMIAGCNHSTVVTGHVTCDGQPIQKGSIAFSPADGQGPSCGGPIANGQYQLEVPPGQKIVQISRLKAVAFDRNDGRQAALADEAIKRGDTSGTYDCVDPAFAQAEGNHARIEVKPGNQTIDFSLKTPTTQSTDAKRI